MCDSLMHSSHCSADLGPEFVYESLRCDKTASAGATGRTLRFLANVDPVDCARALEGLDSETTLVVIVSKTFTTAETMLNARTVKKWLVESKALSKKAAYVVVKQHMVAIRYSSLLFVAAAANYCRHNL